MVAFLEYLLDRFLDRDSAEQDLAPEPQLEHLVDVLFPDPTAHDDLTVALFEMRALAHHDEEIRSRFQENDANIRAQIEDVIGEGITAGVFPDTAPADVSKTVMMLFDGARTRYVVLGDTDAFADARRATKTYLEGALDVRLR
jgi:AcrR family transcriptional regulator